MRSRLPGAGQLELIEQLPAPTPETPPLRILIPCSKLKRPAPILASRDDLDLRRAETHRRLSRSACPAREMYVGRAYQRALTAVDRLALARGDIPVRLHIASAGYGVIDAQEQIVPYEATMGTSSRDWAVRGSRLEMPGDLARLIETARVTIVALSQPYFIGCAVATIDPADGQFIAIGTGRPPSSPRGRQVLAGRKQARALGTTEREVSSVVLERLLLWVATDGLEVLDGLSNDPLDWPPR